MGESERAELARLLQVSRSGFYAWCNRGPRSGQCARLRVEAKVAWFDSASDEVSGSLRILADLRSDGEAVSRKTVAKTMRTLGLLGAWIEDRYNRRRRHSALGQITPAGFEMQYSNPQAEFQQAA